MASRQVRMLGWGLALALVATPLRADMVLLKNGTVHEGKVIRQDEKMVELRILGAGDDEDGPSITMKWPRSRVRSVTITQGLLPTPTRQKTAVDVTAKEPEPKEPTDREDLFGQDDDDDDAGKDPDGGKKPGPAAPPVAPEKPKEVNPLIIRFIEDLGSEDAAVRTQAMVRLTAFGAEATPSLLSGLEGGSLVKRRAILQSLDDIKDRRAVRALIDQLNGPDSEASRLRWAYLALKHTTGQVFRFDEKERRARRGTDIKRWLKWFESVKDKYPEQIGYEEEAGAPPAAP